MSNIVPTPPSFIFGYWRPWKEDSNLFDSYMDYARDTSLAKYGADTVGKYINQASQQQVQAIGQLGRAIGGGMNMLSGGLSDVRQGIMALEDSLNTGMQTISSGLSFISSQVNNVNANLYFINKNLDIVIEQQRLSNLLQQNISELLRVPDSEKERQHLIEKGIKHFVNASKNDELYEDALKNLLKAEELSDDDYFVLHRIGCIYLYAPKYINPEKAFDYFKRAGKYSSVESDPKAVRLVNVLTDNFKVANSEINNDTNKIKLLAADAYEKAAFAAYVLGQFDDAVSYQGKAVNYQAIPQNYFLLSKYQVRNGQLQSALQSLDIAIDGLPVIAIGVLKEIDLMNESEVLKLVNSKIELLNGKIDQLIVKWSGIASIEANKIVAHLKEAKELSYDLKCERYDELLAKAYLASGELVELKNELSKLKSLVEGSVFTTFNKNDIINELNLAENYSLEKMRDTFNALKTKVEDDKPKISSKRAGGIVFYVDETGYHGLVCAENDFGNNDWETAKQVCKKSDYNGYSDWRLPSLDEIKLIYNNLFKAGIVGFESSYYWSSSEDSTDNACYFPFSGYGNTIKGSKLGPRGVRAVRAF